MPRKRTKAEKEVKVAPAAATTPKPASKLTAKPCDFLSTVTGDWMSLWNSTGDTALPRGWGFDRQLAQELVFSVTTAGSLLITGTVSASLTVVDTRTWEIVKELEMEDEESGVVYALSVTHDGQLVVGTEDGYITVWSMKSWECQYGIPAHREAVLCLAQVAANRVASGSADGSIVVWSSDAWESQQTLHGHEGEVAVLEAARGCLFSAGDDCVVRVWSVDHSGWWECESVLSGGHQKPIVSAAMLKESQLVTCDQAAGVMLYTYILLDYSIFGRCRHLGSGGSRIEHLDGETYRPCVGAPTW